MRGQLYTLPKKASQVSQKARRLWRARGVTKIKSRGFRVSMNERRTFYYEECESSPRSRYDHPADTIVLCLCPPRFFLSGQEACTSEEEGM